MTAWMIPSVYVVYEIPVNSMFARDLENELNRICAEEDLDFIAVHHNRFIFKRKNHEGRKTVR